MREGEAMDEGPERGDSGEQVFAAANKCKGWQGSYVLRRGVRVTRRPRVMMINARLEGSGMVA